MTVNLLAISVGNSRTQIGVFVEGKLVERFLVTNSDWAAFEPTLEMARVRLADAESFLTVLATTNPAVSDRLGPLVEKKLGVRVKRVERDLPVPIGRQLDRRARCQQPPDR